MRVYVDNNQVTIIGRDIAFRIDPRYLKLTDNDKEYLRKQGRITCTIEAVSSNDPQLEQHKLQYPASVIPDVVYEVGKQYSAGELDKSPPPDGTIIKTPSGLPILYRNNQWHHGGEKGKLEVHTSPSNNVTILHLR